MKRITTTFAAALIAVTPAMAQDRSSDDFQKGAEEFGRALGHFLDGLSKEMVPVAEAWREMLEDLGDLNQYEAPEELPNGDIIIRRKPGVDETDV